MNVMPHGPSLEPVGPAEARAVAWQVAWRPALAVLGLALAVMVGVLFRTETAAAIGVWSTSTAYNHCWLVLPVAVWLAWSRRDRLEGLAPAPMPAAALVALAPAAAWFAAERMGIMEGRQLALIGLVWTCCLGILGWRVCRAIAPALLYLVFLVPFGAFVTPVLQDITAWMIDVLLDVFGIPHFVDHLIIEIPEGTFLVAEACAGLRFLIAAIAFGTLYAFVMFRSPGRRLVVFALSIAVPIIANGLRAFGIVLLGHFLGSAEAGAADHVLYGWIFFSIVILLLILAGMPFREDLDEPAPPDARHGPVLPPRPVPLVLAGAAMLAVTAAGPAAAALLQGTGIGGTPAPRESAVPLQPLAACRPEGTGLACRLGDQAMRVTATLLTFPPRAGWGAIGPARARALGAVDEYDTRFVMGPPGGEIWRANLRHDREDPRAIAIGLWRQGAPDGGGLRSRIDQALASLRGDGGAPVMVVVEVTAAPGSAPAAMPGSRPQGEVLQAVVAEQGAALAAMAARASRGADRRN